MKVKTNIRAGKHGADDPVPHQRGNDDPVGHK
ncbi:MAG: hypothetical protein JWM26_273 [Betaproteobacteria bacterium]|nr:hypothetical protein [Betaproteobacteria bacterium]